MSLIRPVTKRIKATAPKRFETSSSFRASKIGINTIKMIAKIYG
jgi:hypothetical protein